MFTGKKRPNFDSLSLVEMTVRQSPVGGAPHMQVRICYVQSETGFTFGALDLEHNPAAGKEVLSEKTLKAWQTFCQSLEEDQGKVVFGEGKHWDPQMDMFNRDPEAQAESKDGLIAGLGGGT